MRDNASLFSAAFLQQIMQAWQPQKRITVEAVKRLEVDNSASILVTLAAVNNEKPAGHFGVQVTFTEDGLSQTKAMVLKIKPHGNEIVNLLAMLGKACGEPLASVYEIYKNETGFKNTHRKEQEVYSALSPDFTPKIYGIYTNHDQQLYIILMEYLRDVSLLNSVLTPEEWTTGHIETALAQMARWHGAMLNKQSMLPDYLVEDAPSQQYMMTLQPLWNALLQNATANFPDIYTPGRVTVMQSAINHISPHWQELDAQPKTVIHNDCNPRNSCFKKDAQGNLTFCLYDWELATCHLPHYDVAEFLCFVLEKERYHLRPSFIEYYRKQLARLAGNYNDETKFQHHFHLTALHFGLHRLGMYMMAHTVSPYPFLPRVADSFFDTVLNGRQ